MGYAGRQNIYEGAIRKMVTLALEAREEEFRKEHESDTDEQLLSYLRLCAAKLQHSPWPGEILGGTVIAQRFGSWEEARQKEIYRRKQAEKKILSQKRKLQQEAKRKESEKK